MTSKREKIHYNNLIYGLDIETTTIDIDKDNQCSFMYSFCVGRLNLDTGVYQDVSSGRTYQDLDIYLERLNEYADILGCHFLVYIHNQAYEHSFFINNLQFFDRATADRFEGLYTDKNKPLFLRYDRLEFRCSARLLSKSIEELGNELRLPKLEYNYTKIRTPLTPMAVEEWAYNFRDVEIMLKGVYALVQNNEYINDADDIPYTKTGVMRYNCEHNPEINKPRTYISKKDGTERKTDLLRLNNYLCGLEKAHSEEQLRFWEALFQGGLVFALPKIVGRVAYKLGSFDLVSDYPFQMLYRIFPSDFREYKGDRKRKLQQCMYKATAENLIRPKPFRHMFNATITINNIRCKWVFHPISTAKIENISDLRNGKNCTIINGKIVRCDVPITLPVTCIDYLMLQLFYDFELVEVSYLEIAHRYRPTNEYKLNAVLHFAKKKTEYKGYLAKIEHNSDFVEFNGEQIPDNFFRDRVNSASDYIEQTEIAKNIYQLVKSDLNALYGDNAQHLLHLIIDWDESEMDYTEDFESYDDYMRAQQKTSYIYGLYVPQYARATIAYIAYKILEKGYPVYYIDTDSIKSDDVPEVHQIVNQYNEKVDILNKKYSFTGFGKLEHEYTADKFASLGTKSYLKEVDGKLEATISGLPKATRIYNELLKQFGSFEELVEVCYNYGTTFSPDVARRLSAVYNYKEYTIDVDGYCDTVVSGCILKPVEVTMRDFNAKTWGVYTDLISKEYGIPREDFTLKTYIDFNDDGKLTVEMEV